MTFRFAIQATGAPSAMNEIICPHCHKAFKVDESGYADLLKQVRDKEFNKQLQDRLEAAERDKANAIELERARQATLQQQSVSALQQEIQQLKGQLGAFDTQRQLAVIQAVNAIEKERDELRGKLETTELQKSVSEQELKTQFELRLKDREEEIIRLRDMKAKLSTKMVGETLEQHCETEFNRLRATAFPRAYFEKDNDARTGSKGDYIFRDYDEAGTEYVSIMFDMKNEDDRTATKKKNEDFLKELDRDRNEKGCEYAVLVSMLEPDSDLFNTGIVDMLHRYPKMYVVRPQFFIPMITLLRNAAQNSAQYKSELALVRAQNIDITNFEDKLEKFKDAFSRNYDLASRQFQKAIDEIDKSIANLQKTKDALLSAGNNLRLANEKAQDVTIKRLTHKNPTMKQKFADARTSGRQSADEDDAD